MIRTLVLLALMATAALAQSPPFAYGIGPTTTGRLGYIWGTQVGNTSLSLLPIVACEQDIYAWTPAGTAVVTCCWGLAPTIGHQVVIATEALSCSPPPTYHPTGSYTPIMGVSFPGGSGLVLPNAHPNWSVMDLDSATASFFVPAYTAVGAHTRWIATLDVPLDPLLIGVELAYQAYRVDPLTGQVFAGRTLAIGWQ